MEKTRRQENTAEETNNSSDEDGGEDGGEQVMCEMCNKPYKNQHSLEQHKTDYHKNQTMELSADESEEGSDREVQCGVCQKRYKNLKTYSYHFRKKHGKKSSEEGVNASKKPGQDADKKYSCPHCNKTYTKSYWYRHMARKHNQSGEGASGKISLLGSKTFSCDICKVSEVFKTIFSYRKHLENVHHLGRERVKILSHDGESKGDTESEDEQDVERVPCPYCTLSYKSRKSMRAHCKKKHANEMENLGKVVCAKSDKFESESEDEVPMEQFHCTFCSKSYKSKQSLRAHCKVNHENETLDLSGKIHSQETLDSTVELEMTESEDESTAERFPCAYCFKSYKRKKGWNAHCRKKHGNEKLGSSGRKLHEGKDLEQQNMKEKNSKRLVEVKRMEQASNPLSTESYTSRNMMKADDTSVFLGSQNNFYEREKESHISKKSESSLVANESEDESSAARVDCLFCERTYKTKKSMRYHCRKEHANEIFNHGGGDHSESEEMEEDSVDGIQVGKVQCTFCSKLFRSKQSMTHHCTMEHFDHSRIAAHLKERESMNLESENSLEENANDSKVKQFVCPLCSKTYKRLKTLRVHCAQDHVGKDVLLKQTSDEDESTELGTQEMMDLSSLPCRICGSSFRSNDALRKHLKDTHFGKKKSYTDGDEEEEEEDGVTKSVAEKRIKSNTFKSTSTDLGDTTTSTSVGLAKKSQKGSMKKHPEERPSRSLETFVSEEDHLENGCDKPNTNTCISDEEESTEHGAEEMKKLPVVFCGFCGSAFRSNDNLRRHLNENHFGRKEHHIDDNDDGVSESVAEKRKRTDKYGSLSTDSQDTCTTSFSVAKRTHKNSVKNYPAIQPLEQIPNDDGHLEKVTEKPKKNTFVSDENIVTEVLTNATEKTGPIRLLDAVSPKKSMKKFENFSITVTEEKDAFVRVVAKSTENKVRKYSSRSSRDSSLNSAFAFRKPEMEGQVTMVCDREKVKTVNVGVDEDTSSDGDRTPTMSGLEPFTYNVQQYFSNSPSRFSPFVKLTKFDNAQMMVSQKQRNKYVSSKATNQLTGTIGERSNESKRGDLGYQEMQPRLNLYCEQERDKSYENDDFEMVDAKEQKNYASWEETENVTNLMEKLPCDQHASSSKPFKSSQTELLSKGTTGYSMRGLGQFSKNDVSDENESRKSIKKLTNPRCCRRDHRGGFIRRVPKGRNVISCPSQTNTPRSTSSNDSKDVLGKALRSGKTLPKLPMQGGISRRRKIGISQPYLKRNRAAYKILAMKRKMNITSTAEPRRISPRLKKLQESRVPQPITKPNVKEMISAGQLEVGDDRTLRIENLKHKTELLLHQISEMHSVPSDAQVAEEENSMPLSEVSLSASRRKISKLKSSKSKSVLKRQNRRIKSQDEVPITPEKNIEDSIHFPHRGLADVIEGKEQRSVVQQLEPLLSTSGELFGVSSTTTTANKVEHIEDSGTKIADAEAKGSKPSNRRTRSWSPTKQRKTSPSVSNVEEVVATKKQQLGTSLALSKTPVVKLNKLEDVLDGKYLKFLGGSPDDSVDDRMLENQKEVKRSEYFSESPEQLAETSITGDVEECLNHQTEAIDEENCSSDKSDDFIISEDHSDEHLDVRSEHDHVVHSKDSLGICRRELVNAKVNRAVVDRTFAINNQSHVLFVHKDEIIYADDANVELLDEEELRSLRNQVIEKRSRKRKARDESSVHDETDGNVQICTVGKKDVLSASVLNILNDVEPKRTPLKPVKVLEVKALSEDEIVSSTIVEGSSTKQDLVSRIMTLMDFAENPNVEAPVIQVTEPSFVIKKDMKEKFPCHKCEINFNLKSSLKQHKSTCHPEDEFRSFDIGKKLQQVENTEDEHKSQPVEVICDQPHTQDNSEPDYKEIQEGLKHMYGGTFDAQLVVKKLKLEDTIHIGDMVLQRKCKSTWRAVKEKSVSASSLPCAGIEKSSSDKNGGFCEKEKALKKSEMPEEQKSENSKVDQTEIPSASGAANAEIATSSCHDSLTKRPSEKKKNSGKTSRDSKHKERSSKKVAPAPLTDFERAILEPKKKHKKFKRRLSIQGSEKEMSVSDSREKVPENTKERSIADSQEKGKTTSPKEKKEKDKKLKYGSIAITPSSKIVQKILREKAREEEMERLKFVPRTDEPLPSFEEILQQKPKPIDIKTADDKNGKDFGDLRCEQDVADAGNGDGGDESPETETESPNDFSSTSSTASSQNKIVTANASNLSKVAKSKEERNEVLAAITGRPKELSSKPFRIPKRNEVESVLKWKSPLQDVGHIEMFKFGPKQELNKMKSSVLGSERVNIYNAILSDVENPGELELKKSSVAQPLGEARIEEPSTSSGIKKLQTEVHVVSWRDEDIMTPDSTTPDRYLEVDETACETETTLTESVDAVRPTQPVVSSSSIGELGGNEDELCQTKRKSPRKPGIPKRTSTPLKQNIPSSSKNQSDIPEQLSTAAPISTLFSSSDSQQNLEENSSSKSSQIMVGKDESEMKKDKKVVPEEDNMEIESVEEDLMDDTDKNEVCEEEKKEEERKGREEEEEEKKEDKITERDREKEEVGNDKKSLSDSEDDRDSSESAEETEDSEQDSDTEDETEQKTTKTVMEDDLDVLNVCASDEESWLNEEEELRSQKEFTEEEDGEDMMKKKGGGMEDKEEQRDMDEEVKMAEDDDCMELEEEEEEGEMMEVEDSESLTNQVPENENVIVTESTVEYENNDFQPSTIMKNLIPNGFCYQFIHHNVCNKRMCKYRHDVPSKDEIFKKGIHEISRLYNQSDKEGAFEIYKRLLELNFHDSIPTKHIMMLLGLAEEDCDVRAAFQLVSHVEKVRSIEFHAILISLSGLTPGHYVESLWTLFSCLQKLNKCLSSQNIVILLRAFQEKQQWERLWNTLTYSMRCSGFTPPVYITRSALESVLGDAQGCLTEAAKWIESCDPEQLYNLENQLLNAVADSFLQQSQPQAAGILKSIANKTQSTKVESNKDRDSDTSSVHSEDRGVCQEDANSDNHKFFINRVMGVKFSKNWKYLADIFIELSNAERARDPRYIRAFVDVFTCDKSKPNLLVEALKDFMKNINQILMKDKLEEDFSRLDSCSLGMIGAGLVNFCALSQWWREGLSVIQILQNHGVQYLSRKSPGGALMSTIALDVCLRCDKPYQALQLLSACRWSCVDSLKMDKPDFKERVVQLNTLVKQFLKLKRPPLAFTVLNTVLLKAQRDQQADLYNSLMGFGESFHAIVKQFLDIGDPKLSHDAFEVYRSVCTTATLDLGLLQRLIVACGEAQYLTAAHSVYNYLTELKVYPPQEVPSTPRPLSITLMPEMSLTECIILIEDYLQWLYRAMCDWCVNQLTSVVPEEYLTLSVRILNRARSEPQMRMVDKQLKAVKNLMETTLSPPLSVFITSKIPDYRIQVTIPSLFTYLLALDGGEGGKRQGFRRWSDGGQVKGPRGHQDIPWSSRC